MICTPLHITYDRAFYIHSNIKLLNSFQCKTFQRTIYSSSLPFSSGIKNIVAKMSIT